MHLSVHDCVRAHIYLHSLHNALANLAKARHTDARLSRRSRFIGPAFLDHLQMICLETSVKMHKCAIICAFNRKRVQSCSHLYAVCTVVVDIVEVGDITSI